MIYQTIYLSSAKNEFSVKELNDLLTISRKNNLKRAITGILLYRGKYFVQLLEGERQAVASIMKKVAKDLRHGELIYLYRDMSATGRLFSDWSMGFTAMKFLDKVGLTGLVDHNLEDTMEKLDAQPDSEPGRLLRSIILQNKFC